MSSAVAELVLVRRMRALLVLPLLLVACETTWREGASATSSSGQRLCAKHRVPLVAIRAYQAPSGPNDPVVLVHEASRPYYGVAWQYCPNIIPEHVSLHPAWILREPTTIWYCPLCQKEFLERLRVPREAYDAILETCRERARPVVLTATTAVLGVLPIAFGVNVEFMSRSVTVGAPSTQWWISLSTAIVFGLAFATVLTLVVTPAALMAIEQMADRRRRWGAAWRARFVRA